MFDRAKKLAVTSAILLIAGPAFAGQGQPVVVYGEQNENVRTEHVSYADLDLASAKGERQLYRRVSGAVRRVCLYHFDGAALRTLDYEQCSDGAWSEARPQMAQAAQRARDIALNGKSSIAAAAITITIR
jgi:UrcA family protein